MNTRSELEDHPVFGAGLEVVVEVHDVGMIESFLQTALQMQHVVAAIAYHHVHFIVNQMFVSLDLFLLYNLPRVSRIAIVGRFMSQL